MFDKIDVTRIVRAHFATLKNFNSGRYRPIDIALFTLGPAIITIAFIYLGAIITNSAATLLITTASILMLLSSSLLYLVYRISSQLDYRTRAEMKKQFIREITDNIFYTLLVGLCLCVSVSLSILTSGARLKTMADGAAFFCAASFLLSLLMVLTRTHVLIRKATSEED